MLNKKVSISNLLLSQLTNIKSISLLYSLYIFCNSGNSLLQGPHHVAQKCKKTLFLESLNIKLGLSLLFVLQEKFICSIFTFVVVLL